MSETQKKRSREQFSKFLGDQLRHERQRKKLSAEKVSKQLGFHKNTLFNYENGNREIKAMDLYLLASFYDVPVGLFYSPQNNKLIPIEVDEHEKDLVFGFRQLNIPEKIDAISLLKKFFNFVQKKHSDSKGGSGNG